MEGRYRSTLPTIIWAVNIQIEAQFKQIFANILLLEINTDILLNVLVQKSYRKIPVCTYIPALCIYRIFPFSGGHTFTMLQVHWHEVVSSFLILLEMKLPLMTKQSQLLQVVTSLFHCPVGVANIYHCCTKEHTYSVRCCYNKTDHKLPNLNLNWFVYCTLRCLNVKQCITQDLQPCNCHVNLK